MGTPGRLDDLVSTGKLNLSQIRFLVLDEAVSIENLFIVSCSKRKPAMSNAMEYAEEFLAPMT